MTIDENFLISVITLALSTTKKKSASTERIGVLMQIWNLISERLFTHAVPVSYNNKTCTLISTRCYMLLNLSKLLKLLTVY